MVFKKGSKEINTPGVRENYIFNLIYQIFTLVTPFVTAPYVSRILGAEGIGIQSYTGSAASYFAILAALGTASYGQREIARHRKSVRERSILFWEIELLCIASTMVCLVLWAVLILCSKTYTPYYLVLTMTVAGTALDISWFFGGMEQYKLIAARNMIIKLIGIAVLFLLVKSRNDLLLYVALIAATGFIGNLSMWFYLRHFLCRIDPGELHICRHLKNTLVYFIPTVATSVYTILDKTMLGLLTHDKSQNGYYEYATGFVNMSKVLLLSFNAVMSARMSFLFMEEDYEEIGRKTESSLRFCLFLGVPVSVGLAGIAGKFIPWFLGAGYEPVSFLLYILSPLVLIVGLSDFMGSQILTPCGQRGRSSRAIVTGCVLNVILNLLLIPHFKAAGAAAASLVAECVITGLYLWMCRRYIHFSGVIRYGYKNVLASAIMMAAVWFIGRFLDGPAATLCQVGFGAVSYIIVLMLFKDQLVWGFIREAGNGR